MTSESRDYQSFASQVIIIWSLACSATENATAVAQFDDVLERLGILRRAITASPNAGPQRAYQQALLVLIEDTTLWAEAKRDGGNADAARRDMREAHTIVCIEATRLFDTW